MSRKCYPDVLAFSTVYTDKRQKQISNYINHTVKYIRISKHNGCIYFQTLVILVCSTGPVLGFLFGTQCAAPPPCTCSLATINCKSTGLSQVPAFTIYSGHFYTFIVHLDFNHLTVIQANTFKNLSAINATRINIELNNNHIANIDENAFSGIENALMILNLYSNNLLHVPIALTKLSSLRYLNLVRNPFVNIDASVLTNLSSIISIFKISAGGTASLPHEMSFEASVKDLELSYSDFKRIPSAVCGLKFLYSAQACFHNETSKPYIHRPVW